MALRTFQFCIVFTIGGILINSTVLSNTTTESPASTPSLESPPLSVRLERPSQYVRVVPRGQSVYFDCPATPGPGTSPSSVEYQWYLNDKLITSNTPHYKQYGNGTLFISKISGKKSFQNLTFEGDYRCHFTNNVGTVITEAITLKLPMLSRSFIEQPNNMTVEVGDYAIFNCRITSVPEAIISWEHNSRPLTSERFSSKYFQLPSGSLVISQVQRIEDEGSYSCTATNRIQKKSRKSVSGYLTVIPVQNKPKKPHLVPHNLTTHLIVNVREDVHFYCFANGYQKPFIRWEVPFNSTVNKTVALNSSFISIRNITADIPRNYTCIAQNSLGIESQTWTISLRPYFTEKPISKRVPPARTVRLNCTASGWPEPKITWLKDGEPLGEALKNGQIISKYGRITIKPDNMLVIADTITNDSGLYQCVASNSVGEIRSVARVLVASIFNTRLPPPSPPSGVTCRSYTSNSVCLQWSPQPLNATKIEAYTVHYRSKDGTDKEQQHATNETYSLVELSLPNTQYLFYLRAYIRHAASEQSEPIVCQGGELTKRNITLEAESPEVLNIQWTPLFNDTPCGEIPQYKVQWRRYKHASNSAKLVKFGDIFTNSNIYKYQITDLVPSHTYEVRVLTMFQDETVPWLTFTMPNLTTFINQTKSSSSISHLEAIPTSPNSINLTWQTSLNENFNDFGYYNICYTEAISLETCEENGTYIKSRTNSIEIKNLKPYTLYKFQVRSHDLNDNYGNFSNLVECFTKEGVPSPVRGLTSKYVNATTKTIEWQAPSQINGVLRNYSLYYYIRQCSTMESTINIKHCDNTMLPSLNKWNTIVIAPNKYRAELMNLKPGAQYNVTIFAETGAGRSKPVSIVTQIIPTIYQIGTQDSHGERKPNTDTDQSQTIGIIIGCSIAGLCITLCITYMMWYRRCLKSTLNARHHNNGLRTFNAPTNGHHHQSQHHIVHNNLDSSSISIVRRSTTPAITTTTGLTDNESSESTSIPMAVNVSSERGELHEMQSLVHSTDSSSLPPHIPPVVQTHLDTKGGASFPNGHINGFKFPINNGRLANGIVRITENPQYNIDTEYDTRSAGSNNNSRETNCNFEEDHHLLPSPHGRHLDEDDENDTFNQHHNSTQLTNLDNSLLTNSISSTPRRISPILGPNG